MRREIRTAIYSFSSIPRTRRELVNRACNIEVGLNLNSYTRPRRAREPPITLFTLAAPTSIASSSALIAPGPLPQGDRGRKRPRLFFYFGYGEEGHFKPSYTNPLNPTLVA